MKLLPEQRKMLNIFMGPGGTEAGLRHAGWRSADGIELDPHASETIKANYPYVKVHSGDIRETLAQSLSQTFYPVHLYTWPCDTYTNIAAIHDAQTGEDLYLHALRFQSLLWPECILIENVLGMREKFPVVMELWRNLPHYYCTEFEVHGHDFTLMRKARVFLLLHRQPFRFPSIEEYLADHPLHNFPAILLKPGRKLGDYLERPDEMDERSRDEIKMLPYMETRLNGGYQRSPKVYDWGQETPIWLPTNLRRDRSNFLVNDPYTGETRPFTHREIARLHGFSDDCHFCGGKNARYTQIVDSVMPPVSYVFGQLLNRYFASIEAMLPQPKPLGHRTILSRSASPSIPTPEPIVVQDFTQHPLFIG